MMAGFNNIKNSIVISRYNENLNDWICDIDKSFYDIYIYNKGKNDIEFYKNLENVGRESHTYLNFIIDNYEVLSEYTIFLQGDANKHVLEKNLKKLNKGNLFEKTYEGIGNPMFEVFGTNVPNELMGEFPIYEKTPDYLYTKILKRNSDTIKHIKYTLTVCACFYVHKNNILRHSKETYERLLKEHYNPIHSNKPGSIVQYAGTMEYSWHLIFDDIFYN